MTKAQKPRRVRWMALALGAAVLLAAVPVAFRLFEPVFVYRSGWAPLPAGPVPAVQALDDPAYAAQGQTAFEALQAERHRIGAPALSAAVAIGGRTVWRGVSGWSDVETQAPATFATRFRLGSTSKAVTAVAAGTLVDQGRLDFQAPIARYVPAYRQGGTLADVMSHRAGVRDYGLCLCFPVWEHQNRRHFAGVADEVALVARSRLVSPPGAEFHYTSLGYNLAGAAVENASGQPFGGYLQAAVFRPLGMADSGLDAVPGAERGRAGFYETEKGAFKRAFPVDNSIRWPSGGILSTPADMTRLGNAMLDGRLLSARTRQALLTVPQAGAGSRGGKIYALGWRVGTWTLHGGRVKLIAWHHAGTAVGSSSVFVVFPEKRMVVSLMMNKGGENVDALAEAADRVIEAFLPAP